MLIVAMIAVCIAAYALFIRKPEPKAPVIIERHHHHYRVEIVHRPVYVSAQVQVIQAKIALELKKVESEPPRLPEARLLLNPSTAIERYRSHGRKPS